MRARVFGGNLADITHKRDIAHTRKKQDLGTVVWRKWLGGTLLRTLKK
jgi:hypothetical protein